METSIYDVDVDGPLYLGGFGGTEKKHNRYIFKLWLKIDILYYWPGSNFYTYAENLAEIQATACFKSRDFIMLNTVSLEKSGKKLRKCWNLEVFIWAFETVAISIAILNLCLKKKSWNMK